MNPSQDPAQGGRISLTYLRYLVASVGALGVDMGLFVGALALGLHPTLAAGTGYTAGILAHWLLSSRAVFTGQLAEAGAPRRQQQALFLVSAMIGLGVTMAIVGLGHAIALDPRLAKLVAIGVSFQITYFIRRRVVFA
jgi:putative flippase GtrA